MKNKFSLTSKIYFSMLAIMLLSFLAIGTITIVDFQERNKTYHAKRLKRKEEGVIASTNYFLKQENMLENPDSTVMLFTDKICELADINNLDINVFNLKGELLISSHSDYFEKGVFVFQLDSEILNDLKTKERAIQEINVDTLSILSTYRFIFDNKEQPLAILNIPYFQSNNGANAELKSFLLELSEIYLFFFIGASIIAYFLSKYITGSLNTIGEKFKNIRINKTNEPIEWNSRDEIGVLVNEYNRMLQELEKSASLLAKSERESAWREMAKQVAHEIKNPLTPMKLSIQLLQRSWSDKVPDFEERLEKVSNTMIEQIDALSHIASEFSNFAQMPKTKIEPNDLKTTINSIKSLYDNEAVELLFNCEDTLNYTVLADRDSLVRIFNNLIKNAIQAIPKNRKGQIKIDLSSNDNKILITIQDNGEGIKVEDQPNVFTPNFTTKTSGMGLGLAMVKNMITNFNGSIWFDTEENKGTTFYIEFPAA